MHHSSKFLIFVCLKLKCYYITLHIVVLLICCLHKLTNLYGHNRMRMYVYYRINMCMYVCIAVSQYFYSLHVIACTRYLSTHFTTLMFLMCPRISSVARLLAIPYASQKTNTSSLFTFNFFLYLLPHRSFLYSVGW